MKKSGNKVLVIVLIIIALVVITGGVFAYLYLMTDMLRSGQELFAKYLTQNVNELTQTVSLNKLDEIEERLKQSKNEENITISYIEEGKADPLGQITIDTQNDPINEKYYGIIALDSSEGEKPLKVEYMKENDMYSLRFTNAVKQFLTIQNSNLKQVARNLGIDEEVVEQIPDTINFEEGSTELEKLKITEEEKNAEIKKYSELLYNNIAKEKYTKSKNTVITLNGKTINTNAYSLKLNEQELENILIKLLENLKQDKIILAKLQIIDEMFQEYMQESLKDSFVEIIQEMIDELKQEEAKESTQEETAQDENIIITVYEEKGKTVRVKLEKELEYITLDTTETEGKKQIDVNYTSIDEQNTQLSNGITFIKENDNKLSIKLNNIDGEEQQTYEVNISLVENGNNIKLNATIADEEGETLFIRDINILEEIDFEVTLDNSNNIILNNLSNEQISSIFNLVGEKLNTEYVEQFNEGHLAPFKIIVEPLISTIMVNEGRDAILNTDLSETEREAFNSKFQSYEGTNVSVATVNALLNTVLTHNIQEENQLTERYVIVTGVATLDPDASSITSIQGDKKYRVECKIGIDGLVNEIVISEENALTTPEI